MQTRLKNRKEQIVRLALEFLKTKGFENFSYQDIAKQLEITKASIHHHFPKKADLGVALCHAIQDWHNHEFAKVLATPVSAMEKLDMYINGMMSFSCGNTKICPLSSLQADITLLPEAMKRSLKRLDEHELKFIATILQQGRDNNELNFVGSAEDQALIFVLSCKGALQYSRVHGGNIIDSAIEQSKALLLANN
ncbi:TetR/AcrR family transcriptional regulator [Thalassotalea sp. PLHSN55]|uniref:TetR/AcrR family transcriptional regulator n=1 Tax=Thalassotalea sp. PLHSN55 TaxID=3435888 RepID=UPI003F85C986